MSDAAGDALDDAYPGAEHSLELKSRDEVQRKLNS